MLLIAVNDPSPDGGSPGDTVELRLEDVNRRGWKMLTAEGAENAEKGAQRGPECSWLCGE